MEILIWFLAVPLIFLAWVAVLLLTFMFVRDLWDMLFGRF